MRFTFHYASTLSPPQIFWQPDLSNLHSTMLLLYLLFGQAELNSSIYLHSTMLLLYRRPPLVDLRLDVLIYIPLCFYFIIASHNFNSRSILFTFHYASTLSRTKSKLDTTLVLFTFHYASTLSCAIAYNTHILSLFTFHYASTLSVKISDVVKVCNIYIPLCFYFIVMSSTREVTPLNLHSTMLLLYRLPELC